MALSTENKASRLFKELMGVSETRLARDFFEEPIRTAASVLPNQIWKYGDKIPTGSDETGGADAINAVRSLTNGGEFTVRFDESTVRPIVRRWINRKLSMIDGGTNNSFKILDGEGNPIRNIIPFNFGDGITYNYSLTKDDGSPIAFGVGDWVLDTQSGVLTFYGNVPAGVSASNTPRLSFYEYVGGFGVPETVSGFEGAIIPLRNFQAPVETSAWNGEDTPELETLISNAVDAAYPDFINTYGWDGADDNEGIAVKFEKVIPLRYSHSQDPIKTGVGMANNAEVETLIARRHVATNMSNVTGLTVDFVNQVTPTQANQVHIRYRPGTGLDMSIDGGNTWGAVTSDINALQINDVVKVKAGDAFATVRRIPGNLPTAEETDVLGINDSFTTVGLFYWDSNLNEYMPWVNNDATSKFDFGVPIVLKLGKIPASIKLSQTSTGGFSDAITPEYYGVRPQTVVVAVQGTNASQNTPSPEGVDYLVTNAPGGYLEDVLTQIFQERGSFRGTIFLRTGRYIVNQDFTLANQRGLKIVGEGRSSVFIETSGLRTVTVNSNTTDARIYFEDIQIVGDFRFIVQDTSTDNTYSAYLSLNNVWGPNTDIVIEDGSDVAIINCPSLRDLDIRGTTAELGDRLVTGSVFNSITHNGTNVIYRGVTAQTFTGGGSGTGSWIDSSYIASLVSLDLNNQFSNNTVLAYDPAIDERFKMDTGKIEVIDNTDRAGERRYTSFADPIIYDAITKQFKLIVDDYTMEIKDGKLFVKASADVISFDPANASRPYDTIETPGPDVIATTVQEALEDIYATKADLIDGKLPLQQLPDAIAHAGLSYKGMWSFEQNSGNYPTYGDLSAYDFDDTAEFPGEIQPGWFVVIQNSTEPNNPAADQPATDGTVYTAGDWAVWNGTSWEKVDNSVANAAYSILPDITPDGNQWDEASGGDGLLYLGNTTLVEGFDQVNEILRKLAPPKPLNLNQMSLDEKTPGRYSAIETATGNIRSTVWANSRVTLGTPDGPNDIQHLFFNGDDGTLTAFIDNTDVGSRDLTTADDTGTYGALQIVEDADPHFGVSGKENFWKGLRARISPDTDLDLGEHTYRLEHTIGGNTSDYTLYVDNPAGTMEIENASILAQPAWDSRWISGAPASSPGESYTIQGFDAAGVVGTFYNKDKVARITNNVSRIGGGSAISSRDLMPSIAPSIPAYGQYGSAQCPQTVISLPDNAYEENITFTITPYNSRNQSGNATVLQTGQRIDTITEDVPNAHGGTPATRIYAGNRTTRFPVVGTGSGECGASFISTESLVAGDYVGELQRIGANGGVYRWPSGNYTTLGGPNYANADGVTVDGITGEWRWVAFRIPAIFSSTSAFTLTITNPLGGWSDDANKITANVQMHIKVVGSSGTGWLNANAPYPGSGTPISDGAAAMVAGDASTNAYRKRITFGPSTRTGDLYIRIGLNRSAGLSFGGISVGSLA